MSFDAELWAHGIQSLSIAAYTAHDDITITGKDIVQNSFSVNNTVFTGDKIAFGGTISSQMNFTLINDNGRYDDIDFAGAELVPTLTVVNSSGESETVELPSFYIDSVPVTGSRIDIIAFDKWLRFDIALTRDQALELIENKSIVSVVNTVCETLGVEFNPSSILSLPHASSNILYVNESQTEFTYRDIIRWCCEWMGAIAYINPMGMQIVKIPTSINTSTAEQLTEEYRYTCTHNALEVVIKGIHITDDNIDVRAGKTLAGGEADYTIDIVSNPLGIWNAESDVQRIANEIWALYGTASVSNLKYMPFTASAFPLIYLTPLTPVAVTFGEKTYGSFITSQTIGLNTPMSLSSAGRSIEEEGHAQRFMLSPEQRDFFKRYFEAVSKMLDLVDGLGATEIAEQISGGTTTSSAVNIAKAYTDAAKTTLDGEIDAVADGVDAVAEDVSSLTGTVSGLNAYVEKRAQDLSMLNNVITRGLGFYATTETDSNGRSIYYWHDGSDLAHSETVYKFTTNGILWTTNYKGEDTVWTSGITEEGDAVLRNLNAVGITASNIKTGTLRSNNGTTYFDLDNGELVTTEVVDCITSSAITTTKITFETRVSVGKVTLTAYTMNGSTKTVWSKTEISPSGSDSVVNTPYYRKPEGWESESAAYRISAWVTYAAMCIMDIKKWGNFFSSVAPGVVSVNDGDKSSSMEGGTITATDAITSENKINAYGGFHLLHANDNGTVDDWNVATWTKNGMLLAGSNNLIIPTTYPIYFGSLSSYTMKVTNTGVDVSSVSASSVSATDSITTPAIKINNYNFTDYSVSKGTSNVDNNFVTGTWHYKQCADGSKEAHGVFSLKSFKVNVAFTHFYSAPICNIPYPSIFNTSSGEIPFVDIQFYGDLNLTEFGDVRIGRIIPGYKQAQWRIICDTSSETAITTAKVGISVKL